MADDDLNDDDENPLLGNTSSSSELHPRGDKILREFANDNDVEHNKSSYMETPVTLRVHLSLAMYWFGWSFLWLPLLIGLIPMQVESLVGDKDKGRGLGSVMLLGSIVSPLCGPLFGSISDRSRHRWGRRRPFMLAGTCLSTVGLIIMASSKSLHVFSLAFIIISVANNMILAPCAALLPDVIPVDQRGVASGWIGGFTMLGSLGGGLMLYFINSLGVFGSYCVLILVNLLCTLITMRNVREVPLVLPRERQTCCTFFVNLVRPFRTHDFRVVFGTRFVMQMGILTVQEYLQYFLKDAVGTFSLRGNVVAHTAQEAVSIMFVPILVGAFCSSLLAGFVSDCLGGKRKIILYASAILMGTSCVLFSATRSFAMATIVGLIFGLGYGAFSVIDWAMATDVLPNEDDFAHDMGVWSLALVVPQVLAAPLGGRVLDFLEGIHHSYHLGYSGIFLLACFYFAIGAYFVKKLQHVK